MQVGQLSLSATGWYVRRDKINQTDLEQTKFREGRRTVMKKLIVICAAVCLMLSLTCVSWAAPLPPPGAPSWWNSGEGDSYAYAQWVGGITPGMVDISPPPGMTFWFSNFLSNTDFKVSVVGTTVSINLDNVEREDLYKEIFILVRGTSSVEEPIVSNEILDVDGQIFTGDDEFDSKDDYTWEYLVSGEIYHQPDFVTLSFDVTGLTSITGLWAGENCVPEPATMCLLGLGALSLIRRKK